MATLGTSNSCQTWRCRILTVVVGLKLFAEAELGTEHAYMLGAVAWTRSIEMVIFAVDFGET